MSRRPLDRCGSRPSLSPAHSLPALRSQQESLEGLRTCWPFSAPLLCPCTASAGAGTETLTVDSEMTGRRGPSEQTSARREPHSGGQPAVPRHAPAWPGCGLDTGAPGFVGTSQWAGRGGRPLLPLCRREAGSVRAGGFRSVPRTLAAWPRRARQWGHEAQRHAPSTEPGPRPSRPPAAPPAPATEPPGWQTSVLPNRPPPTPEGRAEAAPPPPP